MSIQVVVHLLCGNCKYFRAFQRQADGGTRELELVKSTGNGFCHKYFIIIIAFFGHFGAKKKDSGVFLGKNWLAIGSREEDDSCYYRVVYHQGQCGVRFGLALDFAK